jgi:hypothetical protein
MPRQVADANNVLGPQESGSLVCEAYELWHVWRVIVPRRSITGELIWGTVLRRRDDDRWIYKKYIDNRDLN